jgi:NitT/TauT family transport system substrate-binding protein
VTQAPLHAERWLTGANVPQREGSIGGWLAIHRPEGRPTGPSSETNGPPGSAAVLGRCTGRLARAVTVVALVAALLAACAPAPERPGPRPGAPVAPIVRVGSGGSLYEAALLLAINRGYLAEQGIELELVGFSAPSGVLWPVVAGQLDAGVASPGVDFFDALGKLAPPRIVASAGQAQPGASPAAFVLRADLARRATLSLRGRPIGVDLYGLGGRDAALALARLRLTPSDVNLVDLPPERAADALADGQLDAAFVVEPDAARLEAAGHAARWLGVDELDPGQELAVVLFSPNFAAHRPSVGARLLAAYLRALGEYGAAQRSETERGALWQELAPLLGLDDPKQIVHLSPVAYPADGAPDVLSLAATQAHFLRTDLLARPADLSQAVDLSFLYEAPAYLPP